MNTWKITDFDATSKIWIYTISPKLAPLQEVEFANELNHFCINWTAHNKELRAFYKIIDKSILILGVDEHLNPASGCSIDKSVHFLEELENKYNISLFDRMLFNLVNEQEVIQTYGKKEFEQLIENGTIHTESKVINTLCSTLKEWNENGVQLLAKSWMNNFFGIKV
jgi:hemerythrin superfamily protein